MSEFKSSFVIGFVCMNSFDKVLTFTADYSELAGVTHFHSRTMFQICDCEKVLVLFGDFFFFFMHETSKLKLISDLWHTFKIIFCI